MVPIFTNKKVLDETFSRFELRKDGVLFSNSIKGSGGCCCHTKGFHIYPTDHSSSVSSSGVMDRLIDGKLVEDRLSEGKEVEELGRRQMQSCV